MRDDQPQTERKSPFGRPKTVPSFDELRKKNKVTTVSKKQEVKKTEWLLPDLNDVPQRFRSKARHIAQSYPDDYRSRLWEALDLPPHGGDEHYSGHHVALQGICSVAVRRGLIHDDPDSDSFLGFTAKMVKEYDHPNPEQQVAMALSKALDTDVPLEYDESEEVGFDAEILKQHEPIDITVLTKESPVNEEEMAAITPRQFMKDMFTEDVLTVTKKKTTTVGYVAMTQAKNDLASIVNPHEDKDHLNPYNEVINEDFDGHNFISIAVFDTSNEDGGRRLNENVIKNPFVVLEMDKRDVMFQQCFTSFVMVVAKFAPLVAAIDAGGKSVHYWFYVGDTSPEVVDIFVKRALQHGADRAILRNVKKANNSLVRMPNVKASEEGRRDQRLIFYAPEKIANDPFVTWQVDGFEEYMQFLKKVECYYCDGDWYYRSPAKAFIKIDRVFLSHHLNVLGCWNFKLDGQIETPANEYLIRRMSSHSVDAVYNRVAGYRAGVHTLRDDTKILVRRNPKVLEMNDNSDSWRTSIEPFLRECFHGDEYHYFMGWLATSVRDFYNNGAEQGVSDFTQSLYLNILGKPNSGKTFILEHLMTPLFGMGAFDCSGLFKESNDFNNTESANELLFLDDSKEIQETESYRRWHGEAVKEFCVSAGGYIHPKGKDKTKIRMFRRLVRLLNFNKAHTLPNIHEDSVADKVLVLVCEAHDESGKKTERSREWGDRMERLFKKEMDSFFYYLVKEYEIPDHVKPDDNEARFPVKAYKNQEVVDLLKTGSKTLFIRDCINTASIPPTGEHEGQPVIEASVDQLHRMFVEHLPSSYKTEFHRHFFKSRELQAVFQEMRQYEDPIVLESTLDGLDPREMDGNVYWRIKTSVKTDTKKALFGKGDSDE